MNISILAVGTELLMGKTVNTNATYLSKAINETGHNVLYHLTVGDNPVRLKETLEYLLNISDMVITTGGLGPTQDDLTKEIIAELGNIPLERDQQAYDMMVSRFKGFNVTMTSNNVKQSDLPKACVPMYNQKGTAPGFIVKIKDKFVAALPGPPSEMKHMYTTSLKLFLEEHSKEVLLSEYIHLFGIGESSAEALIDDLVKDQTNPSIAMYANVGQVSIRVTAKGANIETVSQMIEETILKLSRRLDPYVVGYGTNDLLKVTLDKIINSNRSVSVAESCTGGMLSGEFTKNPGASRYFDRGFVTYSNESKNQTLHVSNHILDNYGAVSEETCSAMLEGLYGHTFSDICIAVTGIAGPGGGSDDKPVGTVYIGVLVDYEVKVKRFNFTGDRHSIQRRTILNALNMIRESI